MLVTKGVVFFLSSFLRIVVTKSCGPNSTVASVSTNPNDVKFYYFPQASQSRIPLTTKSEIFKYREIFFNSTTQELPRDFNLGYPTALYIHGYNTWRPFQIYNPVILAYLKAPVRVNLVVVDWTALANPKGFPILDFVLCYPFIATNNTGVVGSRVADFLYWLIDNELTIPQRIHLLGASVGAHISGVAGACLQTNGMRIGRISGLDPAGPLYQWPIEFPHLNRHDAEFVETFHTGAGLFGTTMRMGDIDVWVNGGSANFPICFLATGIPDPVNCKHNYALAIYAYSVAHRLFACSENVVPTTVDHCPGHKILLGPYANWSVPRGNYYLNALIL